MNITLKIISDAGNSIKREREKRCWTLTELSKKSGVSIQALRAVEKSNNCNCSTFAKIWKAFTTEKEGIKIITPNR